MEKNIVTPTTHQITVLRKHVEAVSALLLGDDRIKPGAAILGGEPLDVFGRVHLAEIAAISHTDFVYLQFDDTPEGYRATDISIVLPRNNSWQFHTGCRLYLSKSGSRAILVPPPYVRGIFRLGLGEIVQVDRKPIDLDAGSKRAEARLAKLIERGIDFPDQIDPGKYPFEY